MSSAAVNPVVVELEKLKNDVVAEWNKVEGGVEQWFVTEIPVLEADVAEALSMFGAAVLGDVVTALTQVKTQGSPVSQVVTSLVQTAEAQGKTIAQNLATVVANQLVTQAQTTLGGMKMAADTAAPATPAP